MTILKTIQRTKIIAAVLFSCAVGHSATVNGMQGYSEVQAESMQFSQAEIEQILAPIALYPDTLLTHILIAATYPIEVIDADRFLKDHKNYSEYEISRKAEHKDWDPSVKALLPFPQIVDTLSTDLSWMRKLGDAFLQDESQVLASIQLLRQKADEAGNLSRMDNVEIVREKRTIIIEPAQPEVIYVPYYDTRVVYGNWHWSHYPPVYWHRPAHYAYYHGPYYWNTGVHIAFDFFFSAFHWNSHHVVRHHHKKRYYHSNRRIATSHHAKRWNHNPKHRKGVAYRSNKVKHRYESVRPSVSHSKTLRNQHKNRVASVSHEKYRSDTKRVSHHVTKRHNNVATRLKKNHAVKVTGNKKATYKTHSAKNNKFYANKGKSERSRVETFSSKTQNKQVIKSNNRVNNGWNKEKRVNNSQPKNFSKNKSYTAKTYKTSQPKQKTYRAKGGHSSKQYTKVAKNSSSRNKMSANKSRQKHK